MAKTGFTAAAKNASGQQADGGDGNGLGMGMGMGRRMPLGDQKDKEEARADERSDG